MDLGWHAGISAAVDLDNSYESEQVHIHILLHFQWWYHLTVGVISSINTLWSDSKEYVIVHLATISDIF